MIANLYGKISNEHGELVAEGVCEVDEAKGSVTLRPLIDMPLLLRQQGTLRLTLDDGSELTLSDRVLHFRLNLPGSPPGSIYRLYFAGQQRLTPWPRLPAEDAGSGNVGAAFRPPGAGGDAGHLENPDRLPPDLHNDPPPPELRR